MGGNMLKQTGYSREAPLLPAILRFSIPLMLTGILQLAYNTADSIIVGRYAGHASLAAVGSTTSIIFLIITLFNGVSIGANYMAARDFGAQDDRGLFRTVHCAALLSVILGLLACVCGLLLSTPLLRWADAPEDVLPLSVLYLRIYFLGVPALVVYNFGSALLRAVGDTFYPLLFMIVSGALNVALNLAVSGGHPSGCGRRGHCHLCLSAPLRSAGDGPPVYLPGAVPSGSAEDPAVSGPGRARCCSWASPLGCRAFSSPLPNVMIQSAHQLLRLRGHGRQLRRLRH